MKHLYALLTLLISFNFFQTQAQSLQPNHEFRALWVSTVWALDWPNSTGAQAQKDELMTLFDNIKAANFNAIFLQVRTESDAFYNSTKEPWSRWLTGSQGGDPGYDPLAFAIEEAHKRGLELHAWVNPYRVNASTNTATVFSDDHISKTKPEWILEYADAKKIINPGIPECREYIASVVGEIVRNYAVDGVHFDDYFYNYSGTSDEDDATYEMYGGDFTNVGDWRRYNINETIRIVNDTIKTNKPELRFGVSPFGIWKSGVPEGIVGLSAYSQIYADALHWLDNQTVDYITPQLYWPIGGQQDFRKLATWWAEKASSAGRHLYAGHTLNEITAPAARVGGDAMRSIALMEDEEYVSAWAVQSKKNNNARMTAQSAEEVPNQIAIVRENRHNAALGSVMFRAEFLVSNPHGFTDYLKETTYSHPAVPPAMDWLPENIPAAPLDLAVTPDEATEGYTLNWTRNAANTHDFKRYVLYSLQEEPVAGAAIPDGAVRALEASEEVAIPAGDVPFGTSYWVVTELGVSNQESAWSNIVIIENDPAPMITKPTQEENLIAENFARFEWESKAGVTAYHYQWADNSEFIAPLAEDEALDPFTTARLFNALEGGNNYYFRLRAKNNAGWSEWTSIFKVTIEESVTGISGDHFAHRLKVYPNPAGDGNKMVVDLALTKPADVNAKLLALDGKLLLQVIDGYYGLGEHTIAIQRGKIRQGVYLLVFWVDDQQKVQRVIFN